MSELLRLRIGSLNCRTLRTDARLAELNDALHDVDFDVIALSEVKRRGRGSQIVQSTGHLLLHDGQTAFIVNRRWSSCDDFATRCGENWVQMAKVDPDNFRQQNATYRNDMIIVNK